MDRYTAKFKKAFAVLRNDGFRAFLELLKFKIIQKIIGIWAQVVHSGEAWLIKTSDALFFRRLTQERLIETLQRRIQYEPFVLALSQNDYTRKIGGVGLRILDEQITANKNKVHYLHLYPYFPRTSLLFGDATIVLGVNLDGKTVGTIECNLLLKALKTLAEPKLMEIRMHHTMGFSFPFIQELLRETIGKRVRFWVHDFFSICPSYYLLRNDVEYCHAPAIDSNACQICVYSEVRSRQQAAFNQLFDDNAIEVVAPSGFALSLWKEKFPSEKYFSVVSPNADLLWTNGETLEEEQNVLRIAFIGYPVPHKGWAVWLKLTEAFKDHRELQFYLFSSSSVRSENFKQIKVSVTNKDRVRMVTALREERIDVAFLWSVCPETFSFTLYESLAAGCYVLTYKNSGNIQDYLVRNPTRGLVLKDEEELLKLFQTGGIFARVSDYRRAGKPGARIIFNEPG